MTRLYEARAYSDAPRAGCAWRMGDGGTPLAGEATAQVAVIGAGFTGLSAALTLAEAGVSVIVLDARAPGWGASGRNGGFCCLGGAKAPEALLARRFGAEATHAFLEAQIAAIDLVAGLLDRHGIDAARHSDGEVQLAHRPRMLRAFAAEAQALEAAGIEARPLDRAELTARGLAGPGFHGGLHVRKGFGLDPGAYVAGLARAARKAGATLHDASPATDIRRDGAGWRVITPGGAVLARRVLIATNGYGPERLGPLRAPVLPVQSNVLVTRPLTEAERQAQGWTSDLMAYDSRILLHYFRLMPDGRFLFGMRGGIRASARAEAATQTRLLRDFHALFPAWREVGIDHSWSGLVAMSRDLVPHVAQAGDAPGIVAAMAYHGNGVAMGTYAGRAAARLLMGEDTRPEVMKGPLRPFPLAPLRRNILRVSYPLAALRDAL